MQTTMSLTVDVDDSLVSQLDDVDRVKHRQDTAKILERQRMGKKKSGHGGKRPGAGGKPIGEKPMGSHIGFRVDDEQRNRWEAAADTAGLSLSEWIRMICDSAADGAE